MNPVLNTLRKTVYFSFRTIVNSFGGYTNFRRVFKIADATSALRNHVGYVGGYSKVQYLTAIAESFPDLGGDEHKQILRNFWREHQRIFLELFMYDSMNGENITDLVSFEGMDNIENALAAGNGAILPVPHFGNVRLLHYSLALKGYPVSVVSSDYSDDPETVRKFKLAKTSQVHQVGFRGQNPRWINDALKNNRLVQIASTAEAGKVGVEINLLNRKLFLTSGWARLAVMTGSPILPTYIIRRKDLRQSVVVMEPLPISPGKNKQEKINNTAENLLKIYENIYRENPDIIDWMSWMVRLKEAREYFSS